MSQIDRTLLPGGFLLCAIAAAGAALGVGHSSISQPRSVVFESAAVEIHSGAIDQSHALLTGPGRRIESLDANAGAALRGYWLAVGSSDGTDSLVLDFATAGPAAPLALERAALGAYETGRTVERDGTSRLRIGGPPPPPLMGASIEDRNAALGAIIEVAGNVDGLIADVPSDRASALVDLARSVGLEPTEHTAAGRSEVRLVRVDDRAKAAAWPVACAERVPLIGGRGCNGPIDLLAFVDTETRLINAWRAATTGPLDRSEPHWLTPEQGGVGWTNGEAQQYRDTQVTQTDQGLTITASPHPEARIDRAPFDSGMVISDQAYDWGRIEVDVTVPSGTGLWPAVWLLGAEACEAPGICSGYGTPSYHEIDLLETDGFSTLSTAVHWFDDRLQSTSSELDVPLLLDGAVHTIAIDRRPGLLVWSLDGTEVWRLEGPASRDNGPHRAGAMRLVVNLAVGGSFAGDMALGAESDWWGASVVPFAYPDLGWSSASLTITDARFTPLDAVAAGR